jgi:predicted esterase
VVSIDQLLAHVFSVCTVDPARLAVAGFSDGASYALSLGITNGDLFSSVMAFSPGFAAPGREHGAPRFFISHGTRDEVLPINRTSRRVAPMLDDAGYDVTYLEFDGGHMVPPEIAREAMIWFPGPGESPGPGGDRA